MNSNVHLIHKRKGSTKCCGQLSYYRAGDILRVSIKRVLLSCTVPALRLEPRPYAQPHSFWRDQFILLQIINHNLDHIINDLIF